jgi:two-component system sensor histidine kinase DesK
MDRASAARGRRWSLVFAAGYLVFLVQPVWAELTSGRPPGTEALVLAAVAVFVVLDLAFWVRLAFSERPGAAIAVLAALCAINLGLALHDQAWSWMFIYCAVAGGGASCRRRWAVPALGAVLLLITVVALLQHALVTWYPSVLVVSLLAGVGLIGVSHMIEANHELRQAREEVARLAVAEERLRFARDLHDLLGHSLSVIVLKSELAGRLAPGAPERAAEEIRDVERVAREALREVREAVAGYRQPSLGQELESAVATLHAAGVAARVEASAGALPTPVDGTLAWAVREGVTNVVRHSRAGRATIRVARADDRVELELVDDGVGCDGCPTGNGLRGLGERVAARAGTVEHGGGPDGGYRLAVRLPLTEAPRSPVPAPA